MQAWGRVARAAAATETRSRPSEWHSPVACMHWWHAVNAAGLLQARCIQLAQRQRAVASWGLQSWRTVSHSCNSSGGPSVSPPATAATCTAWEQDVRALLKQVCDQCTAIVNAPAKSRSAAALHVLALRVQRAQLAAPPPDATAGARLAPLSHAVVPALDAVSQMLRSDPIPLSAAAHSLVVALTRLGIPAPLPATSFLKETPEGVESHRLWLCSALGALASARAAADESNGLVHPRRRRQQHDGTHRQVLPVRLSQELSQQLLDLMPHIPAPDAVRLTAQLLVAAHCMPPALLGAAHVRLNQWLDCVEDTVAPKSPQHHVKQQQQEQDADQHHRNEEAWSSSGRVTTAYVTSSPSRSLEALPAVADVASVSHAAWRLWRYASQPSVQSSETGTQIESGLASSLQRSLRLLQQQLITASCKEAPLNVRHNSEGLREVVELLEFGASALPGKHGRGGANAGCTLNDIRMIHSQLMEQVWYVSYCSQVKKGTDERMRGMDACCTRVQQKQSTRHCTI